MGEADFYKSEYMVQSAHRHEFADVAYTGERKMIAMTNQPVKDFIGKSISLPASWSREQDDRGGRRTIATFSAPGDDATLSLYDRGMNVSKQSATYLHKLLSENAALTSPKVLMPQQIRGLADVMGIANAGDNQFTNNYKFPNPKAPAFHLSSAQLIPVNGRVVLEVQGNYVDRANLPGTKYRGIFVSSGGDGASVKEFFLQAEKPESFAKHQKDYRDAVQTIKW